MEGEDDEAANHAESDATRVRPGPPNPTAIERDSHECSGHSVFRAWCDSCVKGRGRAVPHRAHSHEGEVVPVLSWDYGFIGSRQHGGADDRAALEMGQSPVLCMRDRISHSVFGMWYLLKAPISMPSTTWFAVW